jgi:hypothetical protein
VSIVHSHGIHSKLRLFLHDESAINIVTTNSRLYCCLTLVKKNEARMLSFPQGSAARPRSLGLAKLRSILKRSYAFRSSTLHSFFVCF